MKNLQNYKNDEAHTRKHARTHVQTDGQRENIMAKTPSIKWTKAKAVA